MRQRQQEKLQQETAQANEAKLEEVRQRQEADRQRAQQAQERERANEAKAREARQRQEAKLSEDRQGGPEGEKKQETVHMDEETVKSFKELLSGILSSYRGTTLNNDEKQNVKSLVMKAYNETILQKLWEIVSKNPRANVLARTKVTQYVTVLNTLNGL